MSKRRLTVLFVPESAYGPTNNCIGIGHELLKRGHRVVFAAEASWAGKLSVLGFDEDLVDLAAPPTEVVDEAEAGAFWKEYIKSVSPEFAKSTSEQLETVTRPIWGELIAGAKYCESQLKSIVARCKPDVIVEDNVITFPALLGAGVPYVRIVSCNPLEIPGDDIAPVFSGLPEDDRQGWAKFRAEYEHTHRDLWNEFNEWVQEQGTEPLPDMEFIHTGALNMYVYPEVLDYTEQRPLDSSWLRLDSSVRRTEAEADIPAEFLDGTKPLIYFSLGSLGSADVGLMHRVIDALADTDYRIIVSTGPLHEEITLAANMWGAEFLPQTTILPSVDLVVTHGGNNTVTEAMHFGKPMVVLPLFWDQYDNAQRVHERGTGRRLDTYGFTPDELRSTIAELLADTAMRERLTAIGEGIRSRNGLEQAAQRIEELAKVAVK